MSDEFDSLLDKGVRARGQRTEGGFTVEFMSNLTPRLYPAQEMRRVKSAGTTKQMQNSKSWWSYLFSHQETEGENNHHDNHTHRTE